MIRKGKTYLIIILGRCIADIDCGENMVCLSEFCECAKQKYKRISGPRCIMSKTRF